MPAPNRRSCTEPTNARMAPTSALTTATMPNAPEPHSCINTTTSEARARSSPASAGLTFNSVTPTSSAAEPSAAQKASTRNPVRSNREARRGTIAAAGGACSARASASSRRSVSGNPASSTSIGRAPYPAANSSAHTKVTSALSHRPRRAVSKRSRGQPLMPATIWRNSDSERMPLSRASQSPLNPSSASGPSCSICQAGAICAVTPTSFHPACRSRCALNRFPRLPYMLLQRL